MLHGLCRLLFKEFIYKLHRSKHIGYFFSLTIFHTDGGFPTAHSTTINPTQYSQLQQDEGEANAITSLKTLKSKDNVVKSSCDVTSSVATSSLSNEKHSLEGEKNYVTEEGMKAARRNSENSDSPNYCSNTIGQVN